jgi:phosphoribosylamine--glycine ligase
MGAFSPSLAYSPAVAREFVENIMKKTLDGLKSEGIVFKGVIYFGLMLTEDGLKVIEYNARFGDPEAQVVLPRLKTDLFDIMNACVDGNLKKIKIEWEKNACVCVVLASGGYPGEFEKGLPISVGKLDDEIILFHAGTLKSGRNLLTNGGRVFGITAAGKNIEAARSAAYRNVEKIKFDKMQYRKDIGIKK